MILSAPQSVANFVVCVDLYAAVSNLGLVER
jgi:hypothetical protein